MWFCIGRCPLPGGRIALQMLQRTRVSCARKTTSTRRRRRKSRTACPPPGRWVGGEASWLHPHAEGRCGVPRARGGRPSSAAWLTAVDRLVPRRHRVQLRVPSNRATEQSRTSQPKHFRQACEANAPRGRVAAASDRSQLQPLGPRTVPCRAYHGTRSARHARRRPCRCRHHRSTTSEIQRRYSDCARRDRPMPTTFSRRPAGEEATPDRRTHVGATTTR